MASEDASGQGYAGKGRFRVGCCGQQRHALLDGEHGVDDANAYLQALALRGLSELTLRAYAYDLLLLYRWLADTGRELRDLTAVDLLAFIAAQRQAGAAPRPDPRTPPRPRRRPRLLRSRRHRRRPAVARRRRPPRWSAAASASRRRTTRVRDAIAS